MKKAKNLETINKRLNTRIRVLKMENEIKCHNLTIKSSREYTKLSNEYIKLSNDHIKLINACTQMIVNNTNTINNDDVNKFKYLLKNSKYEN